MTETAATTDGDVPTTPRRTPKGDRTLAAIKQAAREEFRDRGYTYSRVQDIAARADLSNGSFYRYFKDKRDVMMSLLEDLLDDAFVATRRTGASDAPSEAIMLGTRQYFEFFADNSDLFRVLVEVSQVDPDVEEMWARIRDGTIRRLSRAMQHGIESGDYRNDLDTELAAAFLTTVTDHYAYLWLVQNRMPDRTLDEVCAGIADIFLPGILASTADAPS